MAGFGERHGEFVTEQADDAVVLRAADGAVATLEPPVPPIATAGGADPVRALAAHALRPRVIGVLLVRLGGYAAGVFDGLELTSSKVGSRPVHGRAAAGGWSQHRFARRREGQARVAMEAAAEAAVAIVVPALPRLDAVVTGGDRTALKAVLADRRLAGLAERVTRRILDVPDPRADVLRASIHGALAVRITLREPG